MLLEISPDLNSDLLLLDWLSAPLRASLKARGVKIESLGQVPLDQLQFDEA